MLPLPFSNPTTYTAHSGVDFPVARGTIVRASGAGVVTYRGWRNDRAGYGVIVAYDNGPAVLYCHYDNLNNVPAVGSRVVHGTVIGACGNTGNSTGPHVHMEIMSGFGAGTYAGIWNYFARSGSGGGSFTGFGTEGIKRVQTKLISMGHDLGKAGADGVNGPRTSAVTSYEQGMSARHGYRDSDGNKLVVDGIPGPKFEGFLDWWLARISKPAAPKYPVVSYDTIGSIGDVRGLQKIAQRNGYSGYIDNNWGAGSKGGLKAFINANYGGSIAGWLRNRWGYVGNDEHGPVMTAALQRANAENYAQLSAIR